MFDFHFSSSNYYRHFGFVWHSLTSLQFLGVHNVTLLRIPAFSFEPAHLTQLDMLTSSDQKSKMKNKLYLFLNLSDILMDGQSWIIVLGLFGPDAFYRLIAFWLNQFQSKLVINSCFVDLDEYFCIEIFELDWVTSFQKDQFV